MPKQFGKHTTAFVSAMMALAGGYVVYTQLAWYWLILVAVFGAWEAWTIVNDRPHDTISETIWRFNKTMPLIPHLFGVFIGWLIGTGQIGFVTYGLGVLFGHFFFSRACVLTPEDVSGRE